MANMSSMNESWADFCRENGFYCDPPILPSEPATTAASAPASAQTTSPASCVEVADTGAADPSFPSMSQVALSHLDDSVRTTYRLAYMWVKQVSMSRPLVDWTSVYLDELLSQAPTDLGDRLRAHFDALFARFSALVDGPRRGPGTGSSDDFTAGASPASTPLTPPSGPGLSLRSDPVGQGGGSGESAASSGTGRSGASTSSENSGFGRPPRYGGGPVSPSPTISTYQGDAGRPCHAQQPNRDTPPPTHPALSKSARAANRSGRIPNLSGWQYLGLFRWSGQLSDGRALTFDEVSALVATKTQGSDTSASASRLHGGSSRRYPFLRERWLCQQCGKFFHQEVGQTTNLTKHRKKCAE